ncbi:hypothetical protein Efla_006751 [Eimeria flavescens]
MVTRGRMYSDQVDQWSCRRRRDSSAAASERHSRFPHAAEGEEGFLGPPASRASHRMHAAPQMQGGPPPRSPNRSPSSRSFYGHSRRVSVSSADSQAAASGSRRRSGGLSPSGPLGHRAGRQKPDGRGRRQARENETNSFGGSRVRLWEGRSNMRSASPVLRGRRSRGGGVGFRGRGRREAFPSWGHLGSKRRRTSPSPSPSIDSVEDHRRSRSREKARRRRQYETIQRYCRPGGEQQVCWDGFQWVRKGDSRGEVMFDQTMNATRKARRLHIGNLPLLVDATEEGLKQFLWESMRRVSCRYSGKECPVMHVWFAKERDSNYGFVEMASVEDAEVALALNPLVWMGQQLRVNRPTDWKSAEVNFAEVAGAANVPLLESVAAATAVAEATGDGSALAKLLSSLSEEKRKIIADFLFKCPNGLAKEGHLPVELLQCQIQAELLHGQASRVVRIASPVPDAVTDAEMEETLADVLEEVNKRNDVLAALIITQELARLLPAAEVGDIYVQFATSIQADICILSFAGRMYDGHPLEIERFNEMVWRQSMRKFAKSLLQDILAQFL